MRTTLNILGQAIALIFLGLALGFVLAYLVNDAIQSYDLTYPFR